MLPNLKLEGKIKDYVKEITCLKTHKVLSSRELIKR